MRWSTKGLVERSDRDSGLLGDPVDRPGGVAVALET
jgi:hypothetical protein